ncbi:MAG TPA: glycosyltransferase [Mycobacteriales bacterium]
MQQNGVLRVSNATPAPPTRRPRLLVVASTFPATSGDGTPGFVRDLAEYESRHFDTLCVVPRTPGAPSRQIASDTLTIEWFPYFPRRWEGVAHGAMIENMRDKAKLAQVPTFLLAELAAVRSAVRRFKPDVIHAHWVVPQGAAVILAAPGVPFVVTTLGGDLYALKGALPTRIKRAVVSRASAFTTQNADMRDKLVDLGAPPERTHVMPVGADLTTIRAAGEGVERVPGRLLFAGRLVEKKGVAVLLDALRDLPHEGWSLEVAGDGPLRADLERRAAGLPVTFLGQCTRVEMARAMAAAEVVVVPSVPAASGDQDGLPVVMLEAMGAGAAIVASRLPGLDEAVVDGESGVLVPPGDVTALRDTLGSLLADPARRESLGKAASVRAEEFSVEAMGEKFVGLLTEAMARR